MSSAKQCRRWIFSIALPVFALVAAVCLAEDAGTADATPSDSRNWAPPAIEPGAYDDITAYNIFSPARSALAAEAERVPEPDEPEDPGPIEPVVELPPPDPDASLVLVGISVRGASPTAFIEDRQSGEIVEVHGPGSFAQGEIVSITPNQLTYVVDEAPRTIRIGFTLVGERPEETARPIEGRSTSSPDDVTESEEGTGSDASAAPADGLSDLERRMRERRRNE